MFFYIGRPWHTQRGKFCAKSAESVRIRIQDARPPERYRARRRARRIAIDDSVNGSENGPDETWASLAGNEAPHGSAAEVFASFLRLGVTSFGGPVAHLGYFHEDIVVHRKWLEEKTYVDLVALSQFLPGPASTKVGIAIGLSRAGYTGALAAWAGFTMPSALALVLFGFGGAAAGDA